MLPHDGSTIWLGTIASLLAGLATGVGALPVLFLGRTIGPALDAALLGFGAGVMLAATSFSLILPALEAAEQGGMSRFGSSGLVASGMLLGAIALLLADRWLPHEHFVKGREGIPAGRVARIWLFVAAIALHNLPEGLAVGVGFGTDDASTGVALAIGIGAQNMPEGLVVALALRGVGYTPGRSLLVALLTGLVEPVGGLLGVTAVTVAASLLPWSLAFAAGAMLFVVSNEILPESHRQGQGRAGTAGVLVGFLAMLVLDTGLG